MNYFIPAAALGLLLASAFPAAAHRVLGPEASACTPGTSQTAVIVEVDGFADRQGRLRVQLYGDRPDEFLEKGTKLKRIDVPVTASGSMPVCLPLPHAGNYAVAVLHDRAADGRLDVLRDGVGFSRNPKLGLAKPKYRDVVFTARPGLQTIRVVLGYRHGLVVRPAR